MGRPRPVCHPGLVLAVWPEPSPPQAPPGPIGGHRQLRLHAEVAPVLGRNPLRPAVHDLNGQRGERIPVEDDVAAADGFRAKLSGWVQRMCQGELARPGLRKGCAAPEYGRLCGRS